MSGPHLSHRLQPLSLITYTGRRSTRALLSFNGRFSASRISYEAAQAELGVDDGAVPPVR